MHLHRHGIRYDAWCMAQRIAHEFEKNNECPLSVPSFTIFFVAAACSIADLFPPCEILPIWQKFADGKILTTNHSTLTLSPLQPYPTMCVG
jgi:hypothetical protein